MTTTDDDTARRVRENKLRRMAFRQRLQVVKSRRRDPRAVDYGTFWLTTYNGTIVLGGEVGVDIETVEAYLNGDLK